MLANWVKETTATTGTGPITLAGAASGFVSFDDHPEIRDGDTVRYAIEDGNNREVTEGVFTSSGPTLTRGTVIETLVSGVFDDSSPVAITLSGSATVSIVANVHNLLPKIGLHQSGIGNRGLVGFGLDVTGSSATAMSADLLLFFPYIITDKINVASLLIEMASAGLAAEVAKIGVYAYNGTTTPGDLIYESSDIVIDSTGNKTHTTSPAFDLNPAIYWFAYIQEGTTGRPKVFSSTTPPMFPIATDGKCYNLPILSSVASWSGAGSLPADGSAVSFSGFSGQAAVILIGV